MSSSPLLQCSGCDRHVRASDAVCPFCHSDALRGPASTSALKGQRLGRIAMAALGFSTVATLTACYGGPPPPHNVTPPAPPPSGQH